MNLDRNRVAELFARALTVARKAWGNTHPNPMVGALIVEEGRIVAEGCHHACGKPHAEVDALSALAREPTADAVMFVSLEPCSTHGKTPPCTDAILRSGIKKIFIATTDPNPMHAGRGLDLLRHAGLEVELAPQEIQAEAERLNFIFNHNMRNGSPLIALKMAETSNGMVAREVGLASRVTEEAARNDVMRWRRLFPAICVASGTALVDDPSLTSRRAHETWCPLRILVDSTLSTLRMEISPRKIFVDEFSNRTVVLTTAKGMRSSERVARAKQLGIRLLEAEEGQGGGIAPEGLRSAVAEAGLNAVYCEGGVSFARSLLEFNQVDYLFRYRSPKVFDDEKALPGPNLGRYEIKGGIENNLGEDQLLHGFL